MFREVIRAVTEQQKEHEEEAAQQALIRLGLGDEPMPTAADDPELHRLIEPLLSKDTAERPKPGVIRDTLRRVITYLASENKRKNLLGRGFEDVLAGVISRLEGGAPPGLGTQTLIEDIRGFRATGPEDKAEKVDLWVETASGRRMLVSAKWSVRADREKQMRGDYDTYVRCEVAREPFDYYWITNEFDPARLVANATYTAGNNYMFTNVVHVCPKALAVVHDFEQPSPTKTVKRLGELARRGTGHRAGRLSQTPLRPPRLRRGDRCPNHRRTDSVVAE